jgi:hypothetical protein
VIEEQEIRRFAAALEEVVAKAQHMPSALRSFGTRMARGSVRARTRT